MVIIFGFETDELREQLDDVTQDITTLDDQVTMFISCYKFLLHGYRK